LLCPEKVFFSKPRFPSGRSGGIRRWPAGVNTKLQKPRKTFPKAARHLCNTPISFIISKYPPKAQAPLQAPWKRPETARRPLLKRPGPSDRLPGHAKRAGKPLLSGPLMDHNPARPPRAAPEQAMPARARSCPHGVWRPPEAALRPR
jgi:hypothetical protein